MLACSALLACSAVVEGAGKYRSVSWKDKYANYTHGKDEAVGPCYPQLDGLTYMEHVKEILETTANGTEVINPDGERCTKNVNPITDCSTLVLSQTASQQGTSLFTSTRTFNVVSFNVTASCVSTESCSLNIDRRHAVCATLTVKCTNDATGEPVDFPIDYLPSTLTFDVKDDPLWHGYDTLGGPGTCTAQKLGVISATRDPAADFANVISSLFKLT